MASSDTEATTEVLFYHLEQQPLERILPGLVERSLERGWRVVIEAGTPERVAALDTLLWTYRDDSFLAHGTAADGHAAEHPVFLTDGADNPNGAAIRFLVDGASASPQDWANRLRTYKRVVLIFDGNDADAITRARGQWKSAKDAGCAISYWQQSREGRWERKA